MKTKKKSFVALLATFAVGTAAVAGLGFASIRSANNGLTAHADTAVVSVAETDIKLGVNSVSLAAGKQQTFTFDVANVGTYGFKWISGDATFKFEGLTPDVGETEPEEGEATEMKDTHGLSENLTSFYVVVNTPDTAKVTVTAVDDTEIKFEVSYLIDTGTNEITLKAGVPQTFAMNSVNAGSYELIWEEGEGTVSFSGVGEYVLNAENTAYSLELTSPATTVVTVVSETDTTLKFTLKYSTEIKNLDLGENVVALKAGIHISAVIKGVAGYYTFTWLDGAANVKLDVEGEIVTKLINKNNVTYTVYIASPSTTIIDLSYRLNSDFKFDLSYSETDPNATENALIVGDTVVHASGWGENYTFTAPEAGTYVITADSSNAYIMVEGLYGADWVELPYKFTVTAGETITFVMSTDDFEDEDYTVNIVKVAE